MYTGLFGAMSRERPRGFSWSLTGTRLLVGLLLPPLLLASRSAAGQGVGYAVLPSAGYIHWNDDLGLERTPLFGARLAADFGALVGLDAHYLLRSGVAGHFSTTGLTDAQGNPLADGELDVTSYGLGVRLNVGRGRIAPFLRASGGVFRFDRSGRDPTRQLALAYGGGVRWNVTSRLRAQVSAEDTRLRIDRSALAPGAEPGTDPQRHEMRSNLTLSAGLGFALGPQRTGIEPRERWSLASVPVEPFVGRLEFTAPGLPSQYLAGLRAGLDVGNYVGLRGFYWRGVSSGFTSAEPVQSVGGEVQFNLNVAPRLAPYLVVGGGTLDFRSGYEDIASPAPSDRVMLILGGGIGLRLTDQFRLNIAVRDLMHAPDHDAADVSDTRDLRHDWLYSAGVTFSIGRGRRGIEILPDRRAPRVSDPASPLAVDTMAPMPAAPEPRLVVGVTPPDSAAAARPPEVVVATTPTTVPIPDTAAPRPPFHSGTVVAIPLPTQGELYIRYGPPPEREMVSPPIGARTGIDDVRAREGAPAIEPSVERGPGRESAAQRPGIDDWRMDALTARLDSLSARVERALAGSRSIDSSLVRDLVALEIARQPYGVQVRQPSIETLLPAPARAEMQRAARVAEQADEVADLREERDVALAELRRMRSRLDSLEAALDREAAASATTREAADARDRRWSDAVRAISDLRPGVVTVGETDRGLTIVLGYGLLASGSASVSNEMRQLLGPIASVLAQYPDHPVAVEGHTDSTGSDPLNQQLSRQRAEAVRDALVALGIAPSRITVVGHASASPVADNATAEGRARNRRVEIILLGAGLAQAPPER
ncbi:MAG TPA: OmpA family protein [Gemmatimonadaceae bacterium]|nr:OmpA family protein [Gemmatimonadaceae bacterium]